MKRLEIYLNKGLQSLVKKKLNIFLLLNLNFFTERSSENQESLSNKRIFRRCSQWNK